MARRSPGEKRGRDWGTYRPESGAYPEEIAVAKVEETAEGDEDDRVEVYMRGMARNVCRDCPISLFRVFCFVFKPQIFVHINQH